MSFLLTKKIKATMLRTKPTNVRTAATDTSPLLVLLWSRSILNLSFFMSSFI